MEISLYERDLGRRHSRSESFHNFLMMVGIKLGSVKNVAKP